MTLTITDAFDLPAAKDIQAMGFVVRLREDDIASPAVKKLVDDYVITPSVAKELPRILDEMKQVFDRGEEYGRFIHGSFGSGKSHFMTMLSLLVEGAKPAWDKCRPLFVQQKTDATEHQSWLASAGLLVVRIHLLSIRGKSHGLDRAVYDGFNEALKRRGKAPFEFLNVGAIFEQVRREAKEYGDIVWKRLESANIIGSKEDFEAVANGSPKSREQFARAWLKYKDRDATDAGIDPRWSEGLARMAQHAKDQGFGGIVLMVDEFLLWLAEKSGQEFVQEINNLNVIVDHNTGQRAAPIFVFVARQRNLQEFFPDLVDESKIHEHLDHHAKRFEVTKLQDVELRHIVKGRVLRVKNETAVAVNEAVRTLAEHHAGALPALLAGGDIQYLRDVYPFHPALIEMLVDVTSLMQRERSALRMLYELLVVHYPKLPLGEFLPVGSAFAAIFPESGVEASKKVEVMQEIHQRYYSQIVLNLRKMREEQGAEFSDERYRALDQMVRTVLLAEVSPRLRQGGLTIERLVQLNEVDVDGETFRGKVRVAETDLLALSQRVPDLQIAGKGKTAVVRFVLGRVSLGEVLNRARSKVDSNNQRFAVFYTALKAALNLTDEKGFEPGSLNDGDWDLTWRKTKRRGRLQFANVRDLGNDKFKPLDAAFKILIDYPWDDAGFTVDHDRTKAASVQKKEGNFFTVCWLPRHMTSNELAVLTDLSAVEFLLSTEGQETLLEPMGPQDRSKILDLASVRLNTLRGQLTELLRQLYVEHGEFCALMPGIESKPPRTTLEENLEHIATALMDRRFPHHPHFEAEPKKSDLEQLLQWMKEAGEANASVVYDEPTGKVLRNIAKPLELVDLGQSKATLRLDTRYIKDIIQRTDKDSVKWNTVADHLRETYGFQPMVIDLFLGFLCHRDHRALQEPTGEPVEVKIGLSPNIQIRLQRGQLLGQAEWHRLRDLGNQLFHTTRPSPHRSLHAQDQFAAKLRADGRARRLVLDQLHQAIVTLGISQGDRLKELSAAIARLVPLAQDTTDSHKTLSDLNALWPDDAADPLRTVVQQAQATLDAVSNLDESVCTNLRLGIEHPVVGAELRTLLHRLETALNAAHAAHSLSKEWVQGWNKDAQAMFKRLLAQSAAPPATPKAASVTVAPTPSVAPLSASISSAKSRVVLRSVNLDPTDPDALSVFLASARKALAEQNVKSVTVLLTVEDSE